MSKKSRKEDGIKSRELKSALREEVLTKTLEELSLDDLYKLEVSLKSTRWGWFTKPSEENIKSLIDASPGLEEILDFSIVLPRLDNLDSFGEIKSYGGHEVLHIDRVIPELEQVTKEAQEFIRNITNSTEKAEAWVRAIARNVYPDADVEAAVYVASRGESEIVHVDKLVNAFHERICKQIIHKSYFGNPSDELLEKARALAPLDSLAEEINFDWMPPIFLGYRDEEEDFIYPSIFRVINWLKIEGFEKWLEAYIRDLSNGPTDIGEPISEAWWLFFWCRSDLALEMADSPGLEAWLWSLINGREIKDKPWRIFWSERENPRHRDSLEIAGAIMFAWSRIQPAYVSDDLLNQLTQLIYDSQLESGGWPGFSDDDEPYLLTTILVIHALCEYRPDGWKDVVDKAAAWLMQEQTWYGTWEVQGGPPLMLTTLALDAISLSNESNAVTYSSSMGAALEDEYGFESKNIFLSYSRDDSGEMNHVKECLEDAGIGIWTDEQLVPGTPDWEKAIEEAIANSRGLIILLSPNSKSSEWVRREVAFARALNLTIFPIHLSGDDGDSIPLGLITAQKTDLRKDFDTEMSKLLQVLLS